MIGTLILLAFSIMNLGFGIHEFYFEKLKPNIFWGIIYCWLSGVCFMASILVEDSPKKPNPVKYKQVISYEFSNGKYLPSDSAYIIE